MQDQRYFFRWWVVVGAVLIGLVFLTACALPAAPPAAPTAAPAETPAGVEATSTPLPPPTPTPAPKMTSPLTAASECKSCHADIHDQWSQSYHAKTVTAMMGSFSKYIKYVREQKGEVASSDLMGCLGCHAPGMRFADDDQLQWLATLVVEGQSSALSDIGVDCVACHVLAGSGEPWTHPGDTLVVYGPLKDPVEAKDPQTGAIAHESVFSETMDKAEMCQACHTYITPDDIHVEGGTWDIVCSLTYDAWLDASTGAAAGNQCQDCHMAAADGLAAQMEGVALPRRAVPGHLFPGWHSDAMLQQATQLAVETKVEGGNLLVTVAINNKAGHRIPDT